jgi:putative nucleotidyltransferase with HDIG domain
MQELDDYINKVKHLPPAPVVLPQLLPLLNQPDIDCSRVAEVITYDQSLTAAVIQTCNSAYFAGRSPVEDIQEAIQRLGFREVYQIVLAVSGARVLGPAQKGYGIAEGELWRHAVCTAVAAQLMADDKGEDTSVVFTAALMHDVGKLVLAGALESIYAKVVGETELNQYSLLETEKKLLGVQHAEVGGRLLARWKFPANLVSAVWFHHQPEAAKPHERLASYVYLGNMIAHFMGYGFGHQAFALRGRAEALEILGLTADDLARYMMKTLEKFEEVQKLFGALKED